MTLPLPSELRDRLRWRLPHFPAVQVIPRDTNERRCPAYEADHLEVVAYYTDATCSRESLEVALAATPGIYATIQVSGRYRIPDGWPISYRNQGTFRPQVRALYR